MASPFSIDGGIHEVPVPEVAGRLWLCGKHKAAPDPQGLLDSTGAASIVCLVEDHEVSARWPSYASWMTEHRGGRSLRYPIGDLGAPPLQAFRPFLDDLAARLRNGDGLIVHCAAGIGRSGTTAVAVLMLLGVPTDEALTRVGAHRPMAGPEVGSQRDLIADLAAALSLVDGGRSPRSPSWQDPLVTEQSMRPEYDFDFHGAALDTIFDDYLAMQQQCPVSWSDRYGGFWTITGYDDIHAAERDWDTFSVAPSMILPSFGTDRPLIPLDIDPPDLTAYRQILLPFFTAQKMDALEPRTREIARQLLDDVAGREVFDASAFSRMLPTMVFSEYAGFPVHDAAQFDDWVEKIVFARTEDEGVARQAAADVYAYFRDLIATRRRQPGPDVISGLLAGEIHGRPLTDDEMLDICYLLFVAGLETTAGTIRASLWYLAQHPSELAALAADTSNIPRATEEFLRALSPVQAMARTLKRDTAIGGVEMCAGQRVVLAFGAANRDPQRFADPHEIHLDRAENPHTAFGVGAHRCLGSNLARREVNFGLEEFIARFPRFELAEPAPWHGIGPLLVRPG